MLLHFLRQSFINRKKALALMVLSVAMGTAISASLITVALDIKGKVSKELRSFGANIVIEPRVEGLADIAGQKRYLREEDVVKAKTIFWRHNVLGIVPFLDAPVALKTGGSEMRVTATGTWFEKALPLPGEKTTFTAGALTVSPWWSLDGDRPGADMVVVGSALAGELGVKAGDALSIDGREFRVSGTLYTGGGEDGRVIMDLGALQALKGLQGKFTSAQVSALTTPMDDFAYKDPAAMTKKEYEKWYCTGYVTSIAKQLEEVFAGSRVKPVWQVAETEGRVLDRLSVLIYLLTAASLAAAALGMSTTMAASLLSRLDEIALMKALGADSFGIIVIFISEALVIGLAGGLAGYGLAWAASSEIGLKVFGAALTQRGLLLPISLGISLVIASLASMLPIRRALRIKSAIVLKESR